MTTTFDAMHKLLHELKEKISEEDYRILYLFVEAVHDLQHSENSHRIDSWIENRILGRDLLYKDQTSYGKRFIDLRRPTYGEK